MLTNRLPFRIALRLFATAITCGMAITALAPLMAPSIAMASSSSTVSGDNSGDTEGQDRAVDEAALTAQEDATNELVDMIRTYKNTPREADFLEKLAEVQQQSAAMEFRVVHGKARNGKAVDLTRYRKVMAKSIPTLTRLIESYPSNPDAAHFYFMRGVAYQETLALDLAEKDFRHLTQSYPSAPEAMPAYMALGEFAMDKNHFSEAISYFNQISLHPEDSHYPHALYKTAWSQYQSSQFSEALVTSEKLVRFLRDKKQDSSTSSSQGMLENILRDVPLFSFSSTMPLDKTLAFFKSLDHGDAFGHMMVEYANLLRTHDRERDLFAWKDLVLAEESSRPESYDILLSTFDYQLNRMNFADLTKSVRDIVKAYPKHNDGDSSKRAQKLMLDASVAVQKLMLQQPEKKDEYARYLTVIYSGFTQMAGERDPRVRSIHENLAETYFSIKDYEAAVENYRWVVNHGSFSDHSGGVSGADAALKSIAARYETLRERKIVPDVLKAVARTKKDSAKAPQILTEWVTWIDAYVSHAGASASATDNFEFEANRCLYAQGEINQAMDRMRNFALRRSDSSFAIPAATLVVDTEIASGDWSRLYAQLGEFLRVGSWKNTAFDRRIYTLAADTKLKMAQSFASAGNQSAALAEADEFIKQYPANEHLIDALTLAGKTSIAMKNRSRAIGYFAAIAAAAPRSETAAKALLSEAKLQEERYSFSDAARTYTAYLELPSSATAQLENRPEKRNDEIKHRILTFAWLSGDTALLDQSLANKKLCTRDLRIECERYYALRAFSYNGNGSNTKQAALSAVHYAEKASPSVRSIWAAAALKNPSVLSISRRHEMLHVLSSEWKQAEELSRFTILPSISRSVPEIFELDRAAIAQSGHLKADSASLTRRLKMIGEVEDYAAEASTLPWSRIRALVLNDMASIYTDLASGVRGLAYPARVRSPRDRDAYRRMIEQLVSPFDQKSYAIRSEAYRLASETTIEPEVYNEIARAYFQQGDILNSNSRKPIPRQRRDASMGLALVKSVDEHGGWHSVNLDSADVSDLLRARWAAALEAKNWPQVGYFAQEAKEKSLLKPEVTEVAKAVSLASAGAKAEGAMELADVCRSGGDSRLHSTCNRLKEGL
jgi:tetratricopeptide (TPR) repeat protein